MSDNRPLYKPFPSKAKNKSYSVYVMKDGKTKLINFGDSRYEVYYQHKDKQRQKSYLARAKGIRDKNGNLTWKDKNTANYWSVKNWQNTKPSWA
tara:strand:- start:1225 stop:1506 length:282 start_codon:yes stop_codon:yes gene_type:complete